MPVAATYSAGIVGWRIHTGTIRETTVVSSFASAKYPEILGVHTAVTHLRTKPFQIFADRVVRAYHYVRTWVPLCTYVRTYVRMCENKIPPRTDLLT